MLFNKNHVIFHFFVNFLSYSMGSLHFDNFPCYPMGIWRMGREVRTDGRKEIHPCVLQDIGPLGPLPKKEKKTGRGKESEAKKGKKGKIQYSSTLFS